MDSTSQREFIRSILAARGWNVSQLCQAAGLDKSTLSRFMKGRRPGHALRLTTLAKINQIADSDDYPKAITPVYGDVDRWKSSNDQLAASVQHLCSTLNLPEAWIIRSSALSGLGYLENDIVIVENEPQPRDGDIVIAEAAAIEQMTRCHIIRRYLGGFLIPFSPEISKHSMHHINSVRLVGTVKMTLRCHSSIL